MKHIKLFEQFLNEAKFDKMEELIDLLSNEVTMDMVSNEIEDHLVNYFKLDSKLARKIFNAYWKLDAKDRFHFEADDWKKFLEKQGLK